MTIAASLDPFAPTVRGIDEPDPVRAALRAAGPLVRAEAQAGGPVWIVTDDARALRADDRDRTGAADRGRRRPFRAGVGRSRRRLHRALPAGRPARAAGRPPRPCRPG